MQICAFRFWKGGEVIKQLILINGAMGAGKTAVCNELLGMLRPGVFLDGDWCWNMDPFIVTDETKLMVEKNIIYMLRNFLMCSEYKNIIFCWVMHQESIIAGILDGLSDLGFEKHIFTLTISKETLTRRLAKDVDRGERTPDVIGRSVARLAMYDKMDTEKIDVSDITARQAAGIIAASL